jgi:hypothetical protein
VRTASTASSPPSCAARNESDTLPVKQVTLAERAC